MELNLNGFCVHFDGSLRALAVLWIGSIENQTTKGTFVRWLINLKVN